MTNFDKIFIFFVLEYLRERRKFMENYIINENTMAIIPYGKKKSIVYEQERFFIVKKTPNVIIRKSCIANGFSLEARYDLTFELTGYKYKAPIIVDETLGLVFFPTCSPRLKKVEWVALNHIKTFSDNRIRKSTYITFNNDKTIEFKESLNIMKNQILRATHLESVYVKNKKK